VSENDIRTLMRDAAAGAPTYELSTPVIASAAAARTRRRRAWYGVGALGAAAAVTVLATVSFQLLGGEGAQAPVASVPSSSPPAVDPGAISLPSSLPLGELVSVVDAALPAGTTVAELPAEAAFTPAGAITIPLTTAGGRADLAITATAAGCSANSGALDAATLDAISSAVCTAAAAYPNQPGTVLPGSGSVDPAS